MSAHHRTTLGLASPRSRAPSPDPPLCDPRYLPEICRLLLDHLTILPLRIQLDTQAVHATVPMLRGVWGKAIHELYPELYGAVFDVGSNPGPVATSPPYIIRSAPPDPEWVPALEMILFGPAVDHRRELESCWEYAAREGLGKTRTPFEIRRRAPLLPDGTPAEDEISPWTVSEAAWPLPPDAPCQLVFPVPLRLRYRGRLIEAPTLADIVASLNRRIGGYLPERYQPFWVQLGRQLVEIAKHTPQRPWEGERLDLVRYSSRQKSELELRGVTGYLHLPQGPGILTPLLAAALWLHAGKNTVMGMGQFLVEPLE